MKPQGSSSTTTPESGYEKRDWQLRPVAWTLIGILALIVISLIGSGISLKVCAYIRNYFNTQPSPLRDLHRVPPPPRLQVNEALDLADLRASEDAVLNTYGWIDKNAGIVHIPIDQAMKRVVEEGLPTRSQAQ